MTEIRLDTDIAAEAADHLRQLSAGLETVQSSVNSVYQTLTLGELFQDTSSTEVLRELSGTQKRMKGQTSGMERYVMLTTKLREGLISADTLRISGSAAAGTGLLESQLCDRRACYIEDFPTFLSGLTGDISDIYDDLPPWAQEIFKQILDETYINSAHAIADMISGNADLDTLKDGSSAAAGLLCGVSEDAWNGIWTSMTELLQGQGKIGTYYSAMQKWDASTQQSILNGQYGDAAKYFGLECVAGLCAIFVGVNETLSEAAASFLKSKFSIISSALGTGGTVIPGFMGALFKTTGEAVEKIGTTVTDWLKRLF